MTEERVGRHKAAAILTAFVGESAGQQPPGTTRALTAEALATAPAETLASMTYFAETMLRQLAENAGVDVEAYLQTLLTLLEQSD